MSQRDQFEFLQFDSAIRTAIERGLIEVQPSYEIERAMTLRLTDHGLKIFRSLDLSSQAAMPFHR